MEVIMIAQKKVVCIEHDLVPENFDSVLAQNGFEVIHTPIQENNVNYVSRETPDVILIDISNCPNSVWDMYHQIRHSARTCNVPIILIASKVNRIEDLQQLYAANAADCLMKPFALQELVTSIKQALLN
jgi:DNA-binding response OmpR family regulator